VGHWLGDENKKSEKGNQCRDMERLPKRPGLKAKRLCRVEKAAHLGFQGPEKREKGRGGGAVAAHSREGGSQYAGSGGRKDPVLPGVPKKELKREVVESKARGKQCISEPRERDNVIKKSVYPGESESGLLGVELVAGPGRGEKTAVTSVPYEKRYRPRGRRQSPFGAEKGPGSTLARIGHGGGPPESDDGSRLRKKNVRSLDAPRL